MTGVGLFLKTCPFSFPVPVRLQAPTTHHKSSRPLCQKSVRKANLIRSNLHIGMLTTAAQTSSFL